MSGPLWAAFGISLGGALLNGVLGLTRPLSRTYLSFAWIMAFAAAYLYLERSLYAASTAASAIEVVRLQVLAAHGFLAGVLIFVPAYTKIHLPRWLLGTAWVVLGVFFFVNIVSTNGLWFSMAPRVVPTSFLGETYNTVVAPSIGPLQYAHAAYVIFLAAIAIGCAMKMIARGDRQRGIAIVLSLVLVVVPHVVDLVRDEVGGSWPYVAEFGVVAWGIVMSVQLAIDYRRVEDGLRSALDRAEAQTAALSEAIAISIRVRDRLNTPLQTLELGLALQFPDGAEQRAAVDDLRGEVRRLTQLGRRVGSTVAELPAEPSP